MKKQGKMGSKTVTDEKGGIHIYEWVNEVPLNGKEIYKKHPKHFFVNYFSYNIKVKDANGKEKTVYKNSWITDFEVVEKNVEALANAEWC